MWNVSFSGVYDDLSASERFLASLSTFIFLAVDTNREAVRN